jgi:deoxyribodipyrimidine photo-lyase
LRVDDQAALYHALKAARKVWCAFVFDTGVLDALPRHDRRVEFMHDSVAVLDAELRALALSHGVEQVGLLVRHGAAVDEIGRLARSLGVQAVYANHDDEPYARECDRALRGALAHEGIALHTSKDHLIFERDELMSESGASYRVFTPYKNAWLAKLDHFYLRAYPVAKYAGRLAPCPASIATRLPSLAELGFEVSNLHELKLPSGSSGAMELLDDFLQRIDAYEHARNYPAVKGPSYLSVHLRFGTVSVRRLARLAHERATAGSKGAAVWLSELIWREFYHQILYHHPHVVGHAFKRQFDAIRWERGKHADALFDAWRQGRTGYPLVDAAMLQLERSGYMHNRLRMVTASFLVKDLGLDWRRGEAWFAEKLNDFDLASNNGGWQWAASTGCDAQPYFRIFNPVLQSERFDPEGRFIRRYLPALKQLPDKLIHAPWLAKPAELDAAGLVLGRDYPTPLVMHNEARARTLARYAAARAPKPR